MLQVLGTKMKYVQVLNKIVVGNQIKETSNVFLEEIENISRPTLDLFYYLLSIFWVSEDNISSQMRNYKVNSVSQEINSLKVRETNRQEMILILVCFRL